MAVSKCCKCGIEESCNLHHAMLEGGEYVCRNCAYHIRKKNYLSGNEPNCPQCFSTEGRHKMDCSVRYEHGNV